MHKIIINKADSNIGKKITKQALDHELDVTLVGDRKTQLFAKKVNAKYLDDPIDLNQLELDDYWAFINCSDTNISDNIMQVCEEHKVNFHDPYGSSKIFKYPQTEEDKATKKKILLMLYSNQD